MDKIKTILAGIEGLIDRLPDETSFYSLGQRRAYELVKELIYQQFPELQESEDERIRKALVNFLQSPFIKENLTDEKVAPWLAYLEKQKDPHYTKRNALFDKCVEDCDPEVMKSVSDEVDEMLEKEQKPALRLVGDGLISDPNAHFELVSEQKPAEWSEEDDVEIKVLDSIIRYIVEVIDKDVLERFGTNYEELFSWLKDLRSRPKSSDNWKPSEEQMEALKYALGEGGRFDKSALASLYNHLKKLM